MNKPSLQLSFAIAFVTCVLAQSPVRGALSLTLMPVGDSITAGLVNHSNQADRTSYRPWLWETIQSRGDVINGDLSVDFVGINSVSGVGAGDGMGANPILNPSHPSYDPTFDDDNSGIRGFATYSFDNAQLASYQPDIVLMMLGTNDIISSEVFGNGNLDSSEVTSAQTALVAKIDAFQAANPNVTVLLGTVIPLYWYIDPDQGEAELGGYAGPDDPALDANNNGSWQVRYEGDEMSLINTMIRTLGSGGVNDQSTGTSSVIIVDHELGVGGNGSFIGDGGVVGTHTIDGVHPNELGDQLIADNWYVSLSTELTSRMNAVAVPEPSSFLFLTLVGIGFAVTRTRSRFQSQI